MGLVGRSIVTIDDLSNKEIESIFSLADEMSEEMGKQADSCRGKIMATLFYEPSTRTRLSFESAMHRLGGNVISSVDMKTSSLAKGETVADMARVVGGYADIIVIRHPWEGAAEVAAEYAGVPVINAGDGNHEHPTQTLCDLYTIKKERQTIEGLNIALCGDLKHGRTVHSLACALARLGAANIIFCPAPGLEMPEHMLRKLVSEYGGTLKKIAPETLPSLTQIGREKDWPEDRSLDAIYVTPSSSHQLALIPDLNIRISSKTGVDALYVTRFQRERTEGREKPGGYPVIDKKFLKGKEFKRTLVMHPLPRVDELACELDADPRSMYFKQAARGVPLRMALIALLLGVRETEAVPGWDSTRPGVDAEIYSSGLGLRCENAACISTHESQYVKPRFRVLEGNQLTLRCVYCDHEKDAAYVGNVASKVYHPYRRSFVDRIHPRNRVFFESEKQAQKGAFRRAKECRW